MPPDNTPRAERIIAVGGGKGGVGKSVIASNLAVALAQGGKRVLVFDADLGAANQHTLFGIDRPGPGLYGYLARGLATLSDAIVQTGVPDVSLIPGSAGIPGCANIKHTQKRRMIRALTDLDYDAIIIDVGAGVAFNTVDFWDVADLRLTVMTPQLTSIQNAYAFLKSAVYRVIHGLGRDRAEKAAIAEAERKGGPAAPVTTLISQLDTVARDLVPRVTTALSHFGCYIVGNQIFADDDVASLMNVGRLVRDYLGVHAPVAGTLRSHRAVHESVNRRSPLLVTDSVSRNARELRRMARMLSAENVQRLRDGRAGKTPPQYPRHPTGPVQVVDALI